MYFPQNSVPKSVHEAFATHFNFPFFSASRFSSTLVPSFGKYKDIAELLGLCKERALRLFRLNSEDWDVEFFQDVTGRPWSYGVNTFFYKQTTSLITSDPGLLFLAAISFLQPHERLLMPSTCAYAHQQPRLAINWPRNFFEIFSYHTTPLVSKKLRNQPLTFGVDDVRLLLERIQPRMLVAGDPRSSSTVPYGTLRQTLKNLGLTDTLLLAFTQYTAVSL